MTLPQRMQDWDFRYADDGGYGGSDNNTPNPSPSTDTAPPSVQGQSTQEINSDQYGSGVSNAMEKVSPGQAAQSDNQTLNPAAQQALVQQINPTTSNGSGTSTTNGSGTGSNNNNNNNNNNNSSGGGGGGLNPLGLLKGVGELAIGVGGDAVAAGGELFSGGLATPAAVAVGVGSTGLGIQGLGDIVKNAYTKHAEGLAGSNDQLYMDPMFTGDNNTENMDGEQQSGILASFRRVASEDDFYGQTNPDISGTSSAEQGTIGLGGSQTQTGNPGFTGQDQKDMNIMTYSSWSSKDYLNTIKQASGKKASDSDDYKSGFEHGQSGREPDESMLNLSDDYFHGFQDGKVYKQHALESAPAKLIDIKPGSNELPRINHHDPRAAFKTAAGEASSLGRAHGEGMQCGATEPFTARGCGAVSPRGGLGHDTGLCLNCERKAGFKTPAHDADGNTRGDTTASNRFFSSIQICSECSSMRTAHCGMPGCADEEGQELGVGNRAVTDEFLNHFGSAGCRCCNGSGLVCGDCGGSLVTASSEASEPEDEKEDENDGE